MVYYLARGNVSKFHRDMCSLVKVPTDSVHKTSLYMKAQRAVENLKRLRKNPKKDKYNEQCSKDFIFPQPTQNKRKQHEQGDTTENNQRPIKKVCLQTSNSESKTIQTLKKENAKLQEKVRNFKIYRINEKLKRKDLSNAALRKKVLSLRSELRKANKVEKIEQNERGTQCNMLKSKVQDLITENDELRSLLEECNENANEENEHGEKEKELRVLDFRENGKGRPYSAKLRQVYYEFRSRHVALEHINPLIKCVLSLVDIDIKGLPSKSTSCTLTTELGLVSREHVKEEMSGTENITMHRDGTTKKGHHFYGVEFSKEGKTITAGLREVKDGKATTYVDCINEVMQDISDDGQILPKVKNFMTDRCATEQKVNNILSVQKTNKDHDYIQQTDTAPNSFKCAVHPLLQFAEVCQREILKMEKEKSVKNESAKNEPNCLFLLRCVSKLFYKDGSGDPLLATTFIKQNFDGFTKLPILNFRGSRFNVLFYNAAGTYILKDKIVEYLGSSKSSLNYIQSFIMENLQNSEVLCILRALGILSKIITEPYWKFVETKNATALEMGPMYERLTSLLKQCASDASDLLHNEIKLLPGPVVPDSLYDSLFSGNSHDERVKVILQKFCDVLHTKCSSLFKEFLDSGKYVNPTTEDLECAKSCPPDNICVERLMAKLDSKVKSSPSMNTNSIESVIMYRGNNTSQWLREQSEEKKESIITKAMTSTQEYVRTVTSRKKILIQQHLDTIRERQEQVKSKREKDRAKYVNAQQHIQKHGFWLYETDIDTALSNLKTKKDKITALKEQINLYKTLKTIDNCDKHLLAFSVRGKAHDIGVLKEHILCLIEKYHTCTPPSSSPLTNPSDLVGKSFRHVWTDCGKDETWNGRIISFKDGIFNVSTIKVDSSLLPSPPPHHLLFEHRKNSTTLY